MQATSHPIALRGPVPLVHLLIQQYLKEGDLAIDATCGNGKDTRLLAELTGETGHVWAFDIQDFAIQRTGERLKEAGLSDRVTLINSSHHLIEEHLATPVKAIVFNLGWLPGSDRNIITRTETTIPALDASLKLLLPGGILIITCYPGHDGGDTETDSLLAWSASLNPNNFHAWRMGQTNVSDSAPFCLVVQKATSASA